MKKEDDCTGKAVQGTEEILFTNASSVVSSRILYTPSAFARTSLLHLQEIGSLEAIQPHTSARENLVSYLCFVVTGGCGELFYNKKKYALAAGDVVFIDCHKPYSHRTDKALWTLQWCHFYGPELPAVYNKYLERGGQPVFHPEDDTVIRELLTQLYVLAGSADYIRDMRINQELSRLLTLLMSYSWHPENKVVSKKRMELSVVREYLDGHFTEKIVLEDLSRLFYIDKYYLTKIFKEAYGMTITAYLLSRRITKAKSLLRFTDMTMEEIGAATGLKDSNYFARSFKKVEGMTPGEYRQSWKNTNVGTSVRALD